MELTVDQAALNRALRLVVRVVPARPTLPILQMVLLTAEFGHLRLTVTDAEVALTTVVAADVVAKGHVAIPARLLADYVAQLPGEPIRLTHESKRQRVRAICGPFVATLATVDPNDFPAFPSTDERAAVELDAGRLRSAIECVAFAAARDDSRPVLSGVLFDFGSEGLTLAAADGFRLARARLAEARTEPQQLLVPARAVAECARLLADAEVIRLLSAPDGRGIAFEIGATVLYSRLIEGQFPDIGRVIPLDARTRVTVETAAFGQAVRVAGLFGSGDARPVLLEAEPDQLRLQTRGAESGEAESELPASLKGEPQAVVLNTHLLTDLLGAVSSSRLELHWASPQAPVLVCEADPSEETNLWVVMPLYDPTLARRDQIA